MDGSKGFAAVLLFLAAFLFSPMTVHAAEDASVLSSAVKRTGLPLPRWASLKSDKVHMRSGPGTQYPILWVYARKGLPVEITAEFDVWRRIRDIEGAEGWVHQSNLSGKRGLIVIGKGLQAVQRSKDNLSRLRAEAEPGTQGRLLNCENEWCKVEIGGIRGYMKRERLWGVNAQENFD
jgi:SH3-like domain-containing protein